MVLLRHNHSYITTLLSDSPLPAVIQAVDLTVRLLQVELVGHRRRDLREVDLVSNLKYSYLYYKQALRDSCELLRQRIELHTSSS